MTSRAVDVTITGRVQGVFFRGSCEQEAQRLGIAGWIANERGGSVIGHFEGDPDAVEDLIDWCHQGSRHAQVLDIEVGDTAVLHFTRFEIR